MFVTAEILFNIPKPYPSCLNEMTNHNDFTALNSTATIKNRQRRNYAGVFFQ